MSQSMFPVVNISSRDSFIKKLRMLFGYNLKTKRILFSARCDGLHIGHVITIMRLGRKYGFVHVVILDYPEREWPAQYIKQQMDELFCDLPIDVTITINTTHFGKVTEKELEDYDFDLYASGNMEVLNHIAKLGKKILYVDRALHYSATDQRLMERMKKALS